MQTSILNDKKAPYCPGCGHTVITHTIDKALAALEINPLDVVAVSDIGCCGLVDGLLNCHTVHGLHGRSVALATGIAYGLNNPGKKVLVIQGDGGATIGLQHLMEAARQNLDLTLIVQNNMLYGMTGGQISGLSPMQFKGERMPELQDVPGFDICELAHRAGANLAARTFVGDSGFNELFRRAFQTGGFSLLEIVEPCPSHGIKKVLDLHRMADYPAVELRNERPPHRTAPRETASLLDSLPLIRARFSSNLRQRLEIVIAGSAGEGVQSCGDLLAYAGATSGLYTTKKGAYPVTVGSGFSIAEVILSRDRIHYTGIAAPGVMIIVSQDGYDAVKSRLGKDTYLLLDASLTPPPGHCVISGDFRKIGGKKGAALAAVAFWIGQTDLISIKALEAAAGMHRHGDKLIANIGCASRISKKEIMLEG